LAIAVLSGIDSRELVVSVRRADVARLTRIPGIGKKTAERIVLELKDRRGAGCRHERGRAVRRPAARRPRLRAREPGLSSAAGRKSCGCGARARRRRRLRGRVEERAARADAMNDPSSPRDSRLVTAGRVDEDAQYEAGLRPRTLDEYIGQDRIR